MREIATTLTDFLMSAFSFAYALRLIRQHAAFKGPIVFFLAFSVAALIGGLWHGYFSQPGAPGERIVWWLSMLFGGLSAAGLALTGLELMRLRLPKVAMAITLFTAAFGVYVWFDPRFLATIAASAGGTLICLAGLSQRLLQRVTSGPLLAITGLAISVSGAIAQQQGVTLHLSSFDPNATYHLFLIVSLGFFYAGLRRISP